MPSPKSGSLNSNAMANPGKSKGQKRQRLRRRWFRGRRIAPALQWCNRWAGRIQLADGGNVGGCAQSFGRRRAGKVKPVVVLLEHPAGRGAGDDVDVVVLDGLVEGQARGGARGGPGPPCCAPPTSSPGRGTVYGESPSTGDVRLRYCCEVADFLLLF